MDPSGQKEKTRTRVIDLLRREQRTVDELAKALDLTDNAVRMHLDTLEREGLVHHAGVRRSGQAGKPATIYEIRADAEPGFSRVYAPMLSILLETLSERLSGPELEAVLRETGRRIATLQTRADGNLLKRVRAASVWLNQLGALTTVEPANGQGVMLRGVSCPLSVAVSRRPEVCTAIEEMLSALVGADVRQHCMHGARPACRFEFT